MLFTNSKNNIAMYKSLKPYELILTKMGWATFWDIFSQTHLVTLEPILEFTATTPAL
jgi:hypothetical protein